MANGVGTSVEHGVIDLDGSWVQRMRDRLREVSDDNRSTENTIYRVPDRLREVDKETANVYDPYIISFGPYHRVDISAQAMEEHKWRFLNDYLSRDKDKDLEYYLKKIKEKEAEARGCYSEIIELDSNDFVQMLVLDGCFIVEYFLKRMENRDPLLDSKKWFFACLHHDMLLLENQIPFSILQLLYNLVTTEYNYPLSYLALHFLKHDKQSLIVNRIPPTETIHHLLHLYHSYLMPTPESQSLSNCPCFLKTLDFLVQMMKKVPTPRSSNQVPSPPLTIPSATELHEAGVKFMKKEAESVLDIEFSNGVMSIPPIFIYDGTYSCFKNLISLEQCYSNSQTKFTNYAVFMDLLVNTPKDVELLYRKKIILHRLGSHEEVALLFNNLCKRVVRDTRNNYLSPLFKAVTDYYETTWHVWRTKLKRDYFSNPWAFISLVAAFILLSLTITQTIFSILSYQHPQ